MSFENSSLSWRFNALFQALFQNARHHKVLPFHPPKAISFEVHIQCFGNVGIFFPFFGSHHTMDQTIPSRCPKGFGSTLSEFHQLLWLRSRNTSLIRKNQENSQNLGKSVANAKTEDYYSIYMILHVCLYIHIMIKYGLSSTSDS